jgi:hypothetical protein
MYRTNPYTEEKLKENMREILKVTREELLQVNSNQFKLYIYSVCVYVHFSTSCNIGKFIFFFIKGFLSRIEKIF